MTEALVRKRRIRAGHRGVVTRRVGEAKAIVEGEDTPDKKALERYIAIIQEKVSVLQKLDGEILDLLDGEEEITREIEQTDIYNQELLDLLYKMKELACGTTSTPTPSSEVGGGDGTRQNARLPKLTLRTFDGDITQWLPFWDCYEAAVHANTDLSDVQKFTYLKSLMERSAKEAISGLSLSAENYKEAVEILQKRFGNKQRIIARHMDILLNIESVSSPNNVVALRRLYDRVEANVRALKALGVAAESYGSLLSSVMVKKLPQEFRLLVSRKVTDEWDLKSILAVMGEELEARERAVVPGREGIEPHCHNKSSGDRASVSSLIAGQGVEKSVCVYCKHPHGTSECTVVTSRDERKKVLRMERRCFVCLRKGHVSKECRSKARCRSCNGKHHSSLCPIQPSCHSRDKTEDKTTRLTNVDSTPELNPDATPFKTQSITTACCLTKNGQAILLQAATATLHNPSKPHLQMEVPVIFDTGSQQSYICQVVIDRLKLQTKGKRHLNIMTFGSTVGLPQCCELVKVGIGNKDHFIKELMLLSVPNICEPLRSPRIQCQIERYPHLRELKLADPCISNSSEIRPLLLIGLDYYWDFVSGETIRSPGGPVATYTSLGWILSGPTPWEETDQESATLITHILKVSASDNRSNSRVLEQQLKAFWELKSLGFVDKERDIYSQFSDVVSFKNGRYEVMFPWKDPLSTIPDNYALSLRRLRALLRRLRQNPELLRRYGSVFNEQETMGIIERVEDPESVTGERLHYLPHHAVVKKDHTTTKLRVVYDASAHMDGPSLNECLHVGPKFNQKILDILIRFRAHRTALTADVEKAFLMVGVHERDRDVLRFLWASNPEQEPLRVLVYRFTRVVFGVASSPFLLNATIRYHLEKYRGSQPELVEQLVDSTYVDDVITSIDDPEAAYQLYLKSKRLLKEGGFNLRKFKTNDKELQERINEVEDSVPLCEDADLQSYAKSTLGISQKPLAGERKVLGVRWKVVTDELVFDLDAIVQAAHQFVPTKRNVVSVIGRIYDPLGILSPLVIPFKMYFQELSATKLDWDVPLPTHLNQKWKALIDKLSCSKTVTIPRCIKNGFTTNFSTTYKLCGFGDASSKAYAAVVYLLMKNESMAQSRIICSKTRVAPMNGLTIPRLELLSALLLARLVKNTTSNLEGTFNLQEPLCFIDSKVAYYWICGKEKSWRPFIQNRVNEIRRLVPVERWKHCAGTLNPADIPSRGQSLSEFISNRQWFDGPNWLLTMEEESPERALSMPHECLTELRNSLTSTPVLLSQGDNKIGVNHLIQIQNFSDVERLWRVTAYVLLFLESLRKVNRSLP